MFNIYTYFYEFTFETLRMKTIEFKNVYPIQKTFGASLVSAGTFQSFIFIFIFFIFGEKFDNQT